MITAYSLHRVLVTAAAVAAACGVCRADEPIAIAEVNLQKVNLSAIVDELAGLNAIPESEVAQAKQQAAEMQEAYAELLALGAKRLYVHLRATDFAAGGTTWSIDAQTAENAAAVRQWLQQRLTADKLTGDVEHLAPHAIGVQGQFVIGAPSEERLKAVLPAAAAPRPKVQAAYEGLQEADAFLIIFGDSDSRRVVREMFPQLPAPFQEVDGRLLADDISWAAITVKLPPKLQVSVRIEAASNDVAQTLHRLNELGLNMTRAVLLALTANPPDDLPMPPQQMMAGLDFLKLQVDGTSLALTLGDEEQEIAFVRRMLGQPISQAREAAYRNQRMNNFKQIALAILNYESANKTLPAQSSYGEGGKPLLSWRVMILPFLGATELYKEFKLDEPWDSDHNRKLIERMPAVYADPDPSLRAAAGAGKTTFLSTTGEGLFFEGQEPRVFRSITDGSSNTAWLVEVPPERAVEWTRPEDLEDPVTAVERTDRDWFTAGFADGHVRVLSTNNDRATLKALFTPAGGEVIDYSKLK